MSCVTFTISSKLLAANPTMIPHHDRAWSQSITHYVIMQQRRHRDPNPRSKQITSHAAVAGVALAARRVVDVVAAPMSLCARAHFCDANRVLTYTHTCTHIIHN